MRIRVALGIVLIALGTVVISGRATIKSKESILEVGEFKATVAERRPLPVWAGVLGVAGGVVLVLVGSRRRDPGP